MFDDFDTQIQCEEFYFEPSELDIVNGYYDDMSMDDYDWELWFRRQNICAGSVTGSTLLIIKQQS